jgi:16S rRNA (cytidine1402-2'-O)-methyltransferase
MSAGTLYLVPTPIGNLEDLTFRAARILKEVDLVACEDTRTSAVLLQHYGLQAARTSFHAHNEHGKAGRLADRIAAGESVALVSDAGTPGISDPGYLLVRACLERGIPVVALPGATAFVPALVASGLPSDRFVFEGFLPPKKGRRTRLAQIAAEERTVVLYESPHRIGRTLGDLAASCGGDRPAAVARELTKRFEEVRRGTLDELAAHFSETSRARGEFVVVIGAAKGPGAAEPGESNGPDPR